jgi:hypothetical protein
VQVTTAKKDCHDSGNAIRLGASACDWNVPCDVKLLVIVIFNLEF